MRKLVLILIFFFVGILFSQPDIDPADTLDINGIWSGGEIGYAGGYVRWLMELNFEYFNNNHNFGICYSNLLARTSGGGLNTWQIDGVFGRYRDTLLVEPAQVRVGTVTVLDSLIIINYSFNVIFLSDSVAYVPTPVFGKMYLKKQKK